MVVYGELTLNSIASNAGVYKGKHLVFEISVTAVCLVNAKHNRKHGITSDNNSSSWIVAYNRQDSLKHQAAMGV